MTSEGSLEKPLENKHVPGAIPALPRPVLCWLSEEKKSLLTFYIRPKQKSNSQTHFE